MSCASDMNYSLDRLPTSVLLSYSRDVGKSQDGTDAANVTKVTTPSTYTACYQTDLVLNIAFPLVCFMIHITCCHIMEEEKRHWGKVRAHAVLRLDLEGPVSHGRQI